MYVVYEGGRNSSKNIITMYYWSGQWGSSLVRVTILINEDS